MTLEAKFRQAYADPSFSFVRVDEKHPVDLYVGYAEGQRALMLKCPQIPPAPPALETLQITRRQREDNQWNLVIRLERPELEGLFTHLAENLVGATEKCKDHQEAARKLLERVRWWKKLLSAGRNMILEEIRLRGLVAELLFLRDHAIPERGCDIAVPAWVGPEDAPKDFRFHDVDVEIKSAHRDRRVIRISSLEQLTDQSAPIRLGAVVLENAPAETKGCFSVAELVETVRNSCENSAAAVRLDELLLAAGYLDMPEYREIFFLAGSFTFYEVRQDFPRLQTGTVAKGIVKASYEISIDSIVPFTTARWAGDHHG